MPKTEPVVGVLTMAYGTARDLDDVERYYTDIRGGRPPAPHQLEELRSRYAAIGGRSPLWEHTQNTGRALQRELDRRQRGRYRVVLGNKHSPPFVRDAVAELARLAVERAIGLVLAPHYSRLSIGTYERAARQALGDPPPFPFSMVHSWHLEPRFVAALADRVREAIGRLPEERRPDAAVLFTAHSLPDRILAEGDPYPDQLRQSAEAVASRLGISPVRLAYQSAGRTPEPWLGPDLLDVVRQLHADGVRAVVVCPQGFVSDHLEVLYDVDVECRALCDELGMAMVRTRSMNDAEDFVAALADVVTAAADGPPR
jgi:ferrochelatase